MPCKGRKEAIMADTTLPFMQPQGDSLPPTDIPLVSEEAALKALEEEVA